MKWLIILIMSVLFGVNSSYADGDEHRFPMDFRDLKLSSEQYRAVKEAMKEYRHAYHDYRLKSEKAQNRLNELFLNPIFDEAAFKANSLDLRCGSIPIQTQLFSRIHSILTLEQKRRFVRHMKEWEVE